MFGSLTNSPTTTELYWHFVDIVMFLYPLLNLVARA